MGRIMKILGIITILALLLGGGAVVPVSATSEVVGDATEDGVVDVRDLTKVERIIALLDAETRGADATQDGVVDARDITKVERIIALLD